MPTPKERARAKAKARARAKTKAIEASGVMFARSAKEHMPKMSTGPLQKLKHCLHAPRLA